VLLSSLDENRRPAWSTPATEPARESAAGAVEAIAGGPETINPFVLHTTHTDVRNRQES
jgi:hypothetical protein